MRELTADCVTGDPVLGQQPDDESGHRRGGVWELARQPLLLLMLALYAADPGLPPLSADMATADLYQRLLESFAGREAAKDLDHDPYADELNDRTQDHLDRLAVAALAMFNRGRQDIGEEELGTDFAALHPSSRSADKSRPVEAGQRIIGEFFFVHAAEARLLTGPDGLKAGPTGRSAHRELPRRSYEFLHATFGEYLVASWVMNELADVAAKAFAARRGPVDPDDDLLYALLSHQPLAARKSTLAFANEIFDGLPNEDRGHVLEVLEVLLGSYRYRHGSGKYAGYQPMPQDRIRELACYSANLVALRATLEPRGGTVPLHRLLHTRNNDTLKEWRSMVRLWQAGLEADGLQAMLATLQLSGNPVGINANAPSLDIRGLSDRSSADSGISAISLARLTGDQPMERRLRYGCAFVDQVVYSDGSDWVNEMVSWLIITNAGKNTAYMVSEPPEGTSDQDIAIVRSLISRYFRTGTDPDLDMKLVRLLLRLPSGNSEDERLTLSSLALMPSKEFTSELPNAGRTQSYGPYTKFIQRARKSRLEAPLSDAQLVDAFEQLSDDAVVVVNYILKKLAAGMSSWDSYGDGDE